jgi:hypothetical protein
MTRNRHHCRPGVEAGHNSGHSLRLLQQSGAILGAEEEIRQSATPSQAPARLGDSFMIGRSSR